MGGFEIEMPPLVVRGGREEETADICLKSDDLVRLEGLVHGSAPPKKAQSPTFRGFILFIWDGICLGFLCGAAAKRFFSFEAELDEEKLVHSHLTSSGIIYMLIERVEA